ncbi:MAG TPA: response regulator [Anaerolineales bacterium]|nr:response regulator [Anaerolineales bacterium]
MAKILIAEDEKDIRELIRFTLEYVGHQIIPAENGLEAIEFSNQELPALILLDVRMPKMTGYDACRAIKADERTTHIPIVFLSAKGQDTEIQIGMELGAIDYILKPFSPSELIERVQKILVEFQ